MTRDEIKLSMVTPWCSRKGGGIATALSGLCGSINQLSSIELSLFCADDSDLAKDMSWWDSINLKALRSCGPSRLAAMPNLASSLSDFSADISHIHGLWTGTSFSHYRYSKKVKCPYVVSPHGMLDPWALQNSRYLKNVFELVYEKSHLQGAACISALCQPETDSIRKYGLTNPIAIIPNGIDVPENAVRSVVSLVDGRKMILFLGRIHPKKGLLALVRAWKRILCQRPSIKDQWFIAIAGWSEVGYQDELEQEVVDLSLQGEVKFLGPLFGDEKNSVLRKASAFILPSHSEGLPMSILEAWSFQLPVLMTPACNLGIGYESGAAFPIEASIEGIEIGGLEFLNLSEKEMASAGLAGLELVRNRFSWEKIAEQHLELYSWILGGGVQPDFVV